MNYSYEMEIFSIIKELEKYGFIFIEDDGDNEVSFPIVRRIFGKILLLKIKVMDIG